MKVLKIFYSHIQKSAIALNGVSTMKNHTIFSAL